MTLGNTLDKYLQIGHISTTENISPAILTTFYVHHNIEEVIKCYITRHYNIDIV